MKVFDASVQKFIKSPLIFSIFPDPSRMKPLSGQGAKLQTDVAFNKRACNTRTHAPPKKKKSTLVLFRYTHSSSTMNHALWQLVGHLSQQEEEIPLPYIPVYHADVRHWWLIWGTGVFLAALIQQMECARLRTSQCCTVLPLCINTAFCCPLLWMHSFPLWKPEFISFNSNNGYRW